MTGRRIQLKDFRVDKHGKLVRDERRLDVCTRLKRRASKKVRIVRRSPTS
jgi:hypothetical protein